MHFLPWMVYTFTGSLFWGFVFMGRDGSSLTEVRRFGAQNMLKEKWGALGSFRTSMFAAYYSLACKLG